MFVKHNRRHFLRSSAGLLVSIPFLPSMAEAQAADKRLKFITTRSQQGTFLNHIRPNISGLVARPLSGNATSYDINQLAGPLSVTFGQEFNALKSKINFYAGLDPMVKYGGHNHSIYLSSYQQCTNADNSELGLSEAPVGKEYIMPPKPSIDQLISANAFGRPYPVHNVAMTGYEYNTESLSYSYNYSGSRIVRVRGFYDPSVHFNTFFGNSSMGTQVNPKIERRKLIVDQILDSYRNFVNKGQLASADKLTLDSHMDFLSNIQTKLNSGQFLSCTNPGIVIDQKLTQSNQALDRIELIEPTYKLVIDIAVAALRCDAIRVFNLCMFASGANVGGGGPHGYHHMELTEAGKVDYARAHDVFYGRMLYYLVNQLENIQDVDGSKMLDNSLVLYGKEMATEGPTHDTTDMAIASIGGLGGKIKTGQYLKYSFEATKNQPYGTNVIGRSYNQFLTSIMQGGFGLAPSVFETNNDFGERAETIWRNTPLVEKRILLPGMFT